MSLDIYLRLPGEPVMAAAEPKIFIREGGQNKEITREEWNYLHPGVDPVTFTGETDQREVFTANITHNLTTMAKECGLYEPMWQCEENGWTHAEDLIGPLRVGLSKLVTDPIVFKEFNPGNGWGDYGLLLQTASDLLDACQRYPRAEVSVWK